MSRVKESQAPQDYEQRILDAARVLGEGIPGDMPGIMKDAFGEVCQSGAGIAIEHLRKVHANDVAQVKAFAREIIAVTVFSGHDIGGDSVQELAEMYGLIRTVAYDPDEHGATEYPVDAGDDWYVFTDAVKAFVP